ncbi:hypothetical protein GCWU000341_02853 [Oribacterium sp. oral taxon 078 str. F0262]|mgnify:FL=1|uniref:AtpZ/AtpI family protein n=1 Tax=Oribacterium sp. oral taxon 078 TaxID=652706 RepID=UPI0001BCBCFF|nr:AtpZ/AtpI family protein [Oribacterium sp. oral taxon 078]EFE90355.1 hypothetical protein GCWU000341_02853 [Oribacterium sp. oral taxon 078 str. F0262]
MRKWSSIYRNISILTQLGLSLAMPLLLCLFLCQQLSLRFSLGEWVYIPGFFFGLGGSFMTAWKLFRSIMKREEEEKKKRETAAFNQHRG